MTISAALRLLVVMLLWAGCFPLITWGLDLAPHLAFATMRAALAGLCLIGLGALFRRPLPRGGQTWSLVVVIGLGATTLGFFGMFHAAEFVSPGIATVIANSQPLLTLILAHYFLKERIGSTGTIGLVVGFTGIMVIAWPALSGDAVQGYAFGIAYIGLAATGIAVSNVAIKRLSNDVDGIMCMGCQLLLGSMPLAVLSFLTEDFSAMVWSTDFLIVLLVLSIFGTSLAFGLWFSTLREVTLSRAVAFTFLVPLFGLAIAMVLFDERLVWTDVFGAMLILTGILLAQFGTGSILRIAGRTAARNSAD